MKTFLQIVAEDVFGRYGADLSRVAVVFPNKRAGLFFNEALAELSECPVWSPAYLSISDLFRSLSRLKSGDPVKLVCELYRVFRQETSSSETLDDFYYWGELLISDFDDVDKNLVDAGRLFANLKDLKEIMNDYDFLDEEQEQAIQQFFRNFSIERRTELKERFISLWNVLGNIYHRYRQTLEEQGIAYEGMLYREAIERLDADSLPYDRYVFVGFNVLNKVETRLFVMPGKQIFTGITISFIFMRETGSRGIVRKVARMVFPIPSKQIGMLLIVPLLKRGIIMKRESLFVMMKKPIVK